MGRLLNTLGKTRSSLGGYVTQCLRQMTSDAETLRKMNSEIDRLTAKKLRAELAWRETEIASAKSYRPLWAK